MKTKTLHTIQVLSKLGKIFSKIVMICCIVGFGGCILGMLSVAVAGEALKLGGLTIHGILERSAAVSEGTLYAAMAVGLILCAGEAVLAGFAARYFGRELTDGTPFTLSGAKELMRLGILAICIPLASQTLAAIARAVVGSYFTDIAALSFEPSGAVSLGVMFLFMSLLCRHGAELAEAERQRVEKVFSPR